jgi:hypothetical protein
MVVESHHSISGGSTLCTADGYKLRMNCFFGLRNVGILPPWRLLKWGNFRSRSCMSVRPARRFQRFRVKVGQFSQQELHELQESLRRVGANQPCPRCRYSLFTILDQVTLLTPGGGFGIPGGAPCVTTVCNNCGFISSHLLSVLQPRLQNG